MRFIFWRKCMKKTKIICTMGPNEDNREIMRGAGNMNGMDIARFNFSHGTPR